MDYLQYTKILILPYNSIDVNSRDEIKEFDIDLDDKLKEKLNIEEISLLKKDRFLNIEKKKSILSMISNPILYISQNSISSTLQNFKEERVCLIFIPGEYNIQNENVIAQNIKIIAFSDDIGNYSTLNISSNVLFNCQYFNAKSVKFVINNGKDKYFDVKYSTYSGLIFTRKLTYTSFSGCEFVNDIGSEYVNLFHIMEGSEEVNISDCKFNNSNFEIQKSNAVTLIGNTFALTDINLRFTNAMFHRNSFSGKFRLSTFNSYLVNISNNVFIDVDAYGYLISADHKSKLYLTNNKIINTNEILDKESSVIPRNFSLVNVNRHSKCYIDNNNIELKSNQILASVEFEGELYISNNTFNKKDIEIAGYDCTISTEKNNKSIDDETINFFLTEKNITKPSGKYISFY